jgi:hypothetical protein
MNDLMETLKNIKRLIEIRKPQGGLTLTDQNEIVEWIDEMIEL